MFSNQELDRVCCISTWHKENTTANLHNEELNDSKVKISCNTGTRISIGSASCSSQIFDNDEIINSGPIGRQKLKFFLETNVQSNQLNSLSMSNVSRIFSEWRKENEIKNSFVMELIDFTKLCGVKKNKTYKDLFELLSKIFITKLRNKKIIDDSTYSKFDHLALKCVKMINIPHLVESVIAILTKFNRLSDKVIKEITTPDLYLFPRFLSFYKLAPIKLRQQMWLRRPRWFVYEIIPFIMLFTKILSSVDCYSILNNSNQDGSNYQAFSFNIVKDLLKSIKLCSKSDSDLKTEIDSFFLEFLNKNNCCDSNESKFSQQSNSVDSIYTFISRIQSLYISCVELEHDNIEHLGESCKCLAFNSMDSKDFYKSFIRLQKSELLLPRNSVSVSIKTNVSSTTHSLSNTLKTNNTSNHLSNSNVSLTNGRSKEINLNSVTEINSSCSDTTICGSILRAGRIVAYISYCIGNYRELYAYFVNTLRQLYIDSLFHKIGTQVAQNEQNTCISQAPVNINSTNNPDTSQLSYSNLHLPLQPKLTFRDEKVNKSSEKSLLNSSVIDESIKNTCEGSDQKSFRLNLETKQENNIYISDEIKQKISHRYEQKLNNFSGESYLSSLRVFVALRIFHFNSKMNRSEEEEKKLLEHEKSSTTYNAELISDRGNQAEVSNFDVLFPLAISECDAVAWPCIHIVGNILKDGFSSNKSQESLVNVSSTLIIKSKDDLSDISFIFSEPHFLFICSEFILETSILTMFHSSMDAMLVLNPQRRKIPISLISLGLNSPYLSYNNKHSLLSNSAFLTNPVNTSYSSGPINTSNASNQSVGDSTSQSISPFRKAISTDLGSQSNSLSTVSRKRYRRTINDAISPHNAINNSNANFAIRFDTLLNLLTTFNNSQYEESPKISHESDKYSSNHTQSTEQKNKMKNETFFQQTTAYSNAPLVIINNILKLHNTVFSTFLPLIDRYLELSISSQGTSINIQNSECEKKKSTRNELLKSIRNELIEYINSISLQSCKSYSDELTLKFVRLISTSLFFTGVKPIIKQEHSFLNPILRYSIHGLSYCHFHYTQVKENIATSSLSNQVITPSLPSCINLSIRLLETSLSSDWINQVFLKSIVGLLHTYPRIYISRFDNKGLKEANEFREMTNSTVGKTSLFASIPNDIIHGLLLRIVLPSTRDPTISSTEVNTIHEIINDIEICSIIDAKTKKLFVERFWLRNPFNFNIHFLQDEKGHLKSKNSQKVQFKDLCNIIQSRHSTVNNIYLDIEAPHKTMLWEHHFINSNDDYLLFQKWSLYFINTCKNHDRDSQYYGKILSLNKLLQKVISENNQHFNDELINLPL